MRPGSPRFIVLGPFLSIVRGLPALRMNCNTAGNDPALMGRSRTGGLCPYGFSLAAWADRAGSRGRAFLRGRPASARGRPHPGRPSPPAGTAPAPRTGESCCVPAARRRFGRCTLGDGLTPAIRDGPGRQGANVCALTGGVRAPVLVAGLAQQAAGLGGDERVSGRHRAVRAAHTALGLRGRSRGRAGCWAARGAEARGRTELVGGVAACPGGAGVRAWSYRPRTGAGG